MAASALRLSLKDFLINRGMRIVPALTVELVLSAFVLGPLFTSLPLAAYFTSPHTYQYFTNIVGLIDYFLPGVFVGNPAPEVNNSLWTVPFEYACYGLMAALMVFGLLRKPTAVVIGAILLLGFGLALQISGHNVPPQHIPLDAGGQTLSEKIFGTALFLGRGSRLLVSFLLGVAAFLYRDKLPYDWRLFAACASVCLVAALLGPAPWMTQPVLNALVCPALVYITASLGVSNLPRLPLFSSGDYSYGIYLYGFPIQQAARTLSPAADPVTLFAMSIVAITLFAALSWHFVEKPTLKLRSRFSFVARERLAPTSPPSSRQAGPSEAELSERASAIGTT
jgi:peptidoglycan/LPS O-acetylase OafA/YrhL